MNAKEKINAILTYLNVNANAFAVNLGYVRPQIIYDIQKGKTKYISVALANKIATAYPQINKSWLLASEGEMLNTPTPPPPTTTMITTNDSITIPAQAWEVIKKQSDALSTRDTQINKLIQQTDNIIEILRDTFREIKQTTTKID